jgi:DNA repair exonuclease SbcCD ATPase subunit
VERARIEERAGMVQKALEVLEQQLRDEREAASSQIQQLEADRDKSRARCLELEERERSLAEEKEAAQRRPRKKKDGTDANVAELETELEESRALTAKFEARIKSLEDELATAHQQALQERQTAASRVEQLEAALNEARDQARRSESKLSAAPAGGTRTPGLSSEAVESLYHQSMSRLTVLLACADIVLMNPKLEPSVRQTSQEIKTQGQALLDVSKSFTVPPESQQGH